MKTPAPRSKPHAYEVLHALNREFENVLSDFMRLEDLGFRRDLVRHFRVSVEELRAWANFELTETLHDAELKDWSRYGRLRRDWEKRLEDPRDILIQAQRLKDRQHMKVRRLRPARKQAAGPARRRQPSSVTRKG